MKGVKTNINIALFAALREEEVLKLAKQTLEDDMSRALVKIMNRFLHRFFLNDFDKKPENGDFAYETLKTEMEEFKAFFGNDYRELLIAFMVICKQNDLL